MLHTRGLASLLIAGGICLSGMGLVGCAKNQTTMDQPPPPMDQNPKAQLASDVRERVRELDVRAAEYANNAKQMNAGSEQDSRRLVSNQFALLAQILPMLTGPEMTGDLAQQMRIIESSRSQLSGGSTELASEPTVSTGLRAAHRALASINQRSFSDVPDVAKSIDAMANDVNNLDTVSGPQHRWVAAQAFVNSAEAITKMAQAMNQRLNDQTNRPAETPAPPPAKSDEKGPTAS